jgi:hypothetical protein
VVTDLHVNDLEALYSLLKGVDTKSILHVSVDDTNFLYECGYPRTCGAYYIYAHDRSFTQVTHYMKNIFVAPAALAQHAPVTIEDASGRGLGASGRWAQLFKYLAINATDGGPVARQAVTQVIDESGGKDAATASWLAAYFGVTVTVPPSPPPAPTVAGVPTATATPAAATGGGVVVILGQAEETAFLGNPGVGS